MLRPLRHTEDRGEVAPQGRSRGPRQEAIPWDSRNGYRLPAQAAGESWKAQTGPSGADGPGLGRHGVEDTCARIDVCDEHSRKAIRTQSAPQRQAGSKHYDVRYLVC